MSCILTMDALENAARSSAQSEPDKSGGENVSLGDIESVLSLHPRVAEVAVAGLPDEH